MSGVTVWVVEVSGEGATVKDGLAAVSALAAELFFVDEEGGEGGGFLADCEKGEFSSMRGRDGKWRRTDDSDVDSNVVDVLKLLQGFDQEDVLAAKYSLRQPTDSLVTE
jgi:hypothetical protein